MNLEVLRHHCARRLGGQPLWLAFGLGVPLAWALYAIGAGYEIRGGFEFLMRNGKYFALWNIGFCWLYVTAGWLAGFARGAELEPADLPLSGLQRRLHYLLDLTLLPLLCAGACVLAFAILNVYTGEPYAHGTYEKSLIWIEGGVLNPWVVRMLLVGLTVFTAAMEVLALGLLLDRLCPWKLLALALFPASLVLAHFAIRRGEWDFFRFTYRQTSGYSIWLFVLLACAILLLLALAAYAPAWLRWLTGAVALLSLGALAVAVMAQSPGGHDPQLAAMSGLLGDFRFAASWFAGHLHPLLNISLLMESFPSNVVLDNPWGTADQPWHLPLWLGTSVYPPVLCLTFWVLYVAAGGRGNRRAD